MGHLRFAICDLRFECGRDPIANRLAAGCTQSPAPAASSSQSQIGNRQSAIPKGFTLIELLVVIFIIVLGMTLAIPAIRALTGSRSLEATENSLSSFVNFARTEAIGFQRTEGVIFMLDTGADRVKCATVMDTGLQFPGSDIPGVTYLDLVPDRDPLFLPTGVRVWTMKDTPPSSLVLSLQGPVSTTTPIDPFAGCRYLGFNPNPNPNITNGPPAYGLNNNLSGYPISAVPGGVILFDKNGHLITPRYGLRLNTSSGLAQMIFPIAAPTAAGSMQDWPTLSNGGKDIWLTSQTGLVLFDRENFLAQSNPAQFTECNDTSSANSPLEKAMENWLDYGDTTGTGGGGSGGSLFVFVNRYDGNLIPAE